MQSYKQEHGHLPPAVVCGADGRPLYSWRVTILPFMDQKDLYQQFKLDEPWDSPHNIQLLPKMPEFYKPPPSKARAMPPFHTICHVFVGKGTAFDGEARLRRVEEFPKGICNTILLVEAGKPVPWTKPEELVYDSHGPLPELKGVFRDSFRVGMADGSVRHIGQETTESELRDLIVRYKR